MRFGVVAPNDGRFADPAVLVGLACTAERAGWDGFFIYDHLLRRGRGTPLVDPWIVLAAVAMATSRVRIGPMITPIARRRPWKLARETVTLDRLSGGRLILGVGLGNPEDEFTRFGEDSDPRVRGERLDEGLEVLAGLWSGMPFSYEGRHYEVDDVQFVPGSSQRPRIPVWVAGRWPNRGPFRRAARWDGAYPVHAEVSRHNVMSPQQILPVVDFLREQRGTLSSFDIVVHGISAGQRDAGDNEVVRELADAGVTWWNELLDRPSVPFQALEQRVQQGPPRMGI